MRSLIAGFTCLILPICAQLAFADELDPYIKKKNLSNDDKSKIRAEVIKRVGELNKAESTTERSRARDELTATARVSGASAAFLDEYALQCADELRNVVTDPQLMTALEAALVLSEFDRPQCAAAWSAALSSSHRPVRFLAAKGIQKLHTRLRRASDIEDALESLGNAGAAEGDRLVLREIYLAIDFANGVKDFKQAGRAAAALKKIFDARKIVLETAGRDESIDVLGFEAAGRSSANAAPYRKSLAQSIYGLLEHAVNRLYDPQITPATKASLTTVAKSADAAIRKILNDANVNASPALNVPSMPEARAREVMKALEAAINKIP
jgi:hypothetical protein